MSDTDEPIVDDYPDATWDTPEELVESFGCQDWTLEDLVEVEQAESDIVPTMDDDEDSVASKPMRYDVDVLEGNSFVISGPLSDGSHVTGRLMTREQARLWARTTYGDPVREIQTPHRWALRVRKPTAPGGRYTPPAEQGGM